MDKEVTRSSRCGPRGGSARGADPGARSSNEDVRIEVYDGDGAREKRGAENRIEELELSQQQVKKVVDIEHVVDAA